MEHLLAVLPQPQPLLLDKVSCRIELDFDGGSYEDFPERNPDWSSRTREQWAGLFRAPSDRFKSFLQTWRYFGVVGTFLRSKESGSLASKLTRYDDNIKSRVLDTSNLWQLVKRSQLYQTSHHAALEGKNAILSSYSTFLERASQLEEAFADDGTGDSMRCSCNSGHVNDNPITLYQYVILSRPQDPLQKELIEAICLLLDVFANIVSPEANEWTATFYGLKPFLRYKSVVTRRMREDGWCPWKIGELWNRFNISSMYCIANFGRPDQPPHQYDHGVCTEAQCKFSQVKSETYRTLHESSCDGKCSLITAKGDELNQILKSGSYPLIEHQLSGDHFRLKSFKRDENNNKDIYVAISHVWSDGLGNPMANGIPKCRFESLTKMLNEFTGEKKDYRRQNSLFWLDTVCCPVQDGEPQDLAIARMRDTYGQAHEVLVLENSLLRCEIRDMPDSEIFLRVFSSSWMTRLWTYQEGCLARNLYVQLADGVYSTSVRDGYKKLKEKLRSDIASECTVMRALVTHWGQLKLPQAYDLSGSQRLMSCAAAVRFRCTSQEADEPLCLATVLGCHFSGTNVARDPERAMKWFWSRSELRHSISSRILFLDLETLNSEGYRWAPRTLMNSSRIGVIEHWSFSRYLEEERTSLENDGLHARFSAFALNKEWTKSLPSVFSISSARGHRYKVAVRCKRNKGQEQNPHSDCARHRGMSFAPPRVSSPVKLWILLYPNDFEALRSADNNHASEILRETQSSACPALLVYSTRIASERVPIVYKVGVADVWGNNASSTHSSSAMSNTIFAVTEEPNMKWCCG